MDSSKKMKEQEWKEEVQPVGTQESSGKSTWDHQDTLRRFNRLLKNDAGDRILPLIVPLNY